MSDHDQEYLEYPCKCGHMALGGHQWAKDFCFDSQCNCVKYRSSAPGAQTLTRGDLADLLREEYQAISREPVEIGVEMFVLGLAKRLEGGRDG